MHKREALENIPPEAWLQCRGPQGAFSLWMLHNAWLTACFGSDYVRVSRDTDPWSDLAGSFGFLKTDNTFEFLLFSKAAPLQSYELAWNPNQTSAPVAFRGEPCPTAAATALEGNPQVVVLTNTDPNERIQFHVETLESGSAPHRAAREAAAIEPWRRAISWYLVARNSDPETYMRRVHQAFRQFLESVPLNAMTLEHLQYFQAQRLLPETLPDAGPENMTQLVTDIRGAQAYFNSPMAAHVPRIFMAVDPSRIELIDAQALIMLGALKELRGFIDRELLKLGQTHPEIKRLWNTPNGRAQIMQHPAVLAIMQHPEAQREQHENMEKAMRQQGLMNGNAAEVEQLLANQKMMQAYYGGGPVLGPKPPPPPWKIYQPFDPNDPQPQQGGFDLLGRLGLKF
jgi:hypothetical protein